MKFTRRNTTDYHSYLLRLWRDGPYRPWRASLHCAATGTRHYFADMVHLFAFLQARTDGVDEQATGEPGQDE
jgi:hypothetical protein